MIFWLTAYPVFTFFVGMALNNLLARRPKPPKPKMRLADVHKKHEERTWKGSIYIVPHVGDKVLLRTEHKRRYVKDGYMDSLVENFWYTVSEVRNSSALLKELDIEARDVPAKSFAMYPEHWIVQCPEVEDVPITPDEVKQADTMPTPEELGKFVDGLK